MTAVDGKRARRRRRRRLALVATVTAGILLWASCTSTITPPHDVNQPATVFLLHEAMHTGIVLPPQGPDGEFVEFGFGDWGWFALGEDGWYHVFGTVIWPTQGTLGRRTFGARTADELRANAWWAELSPVVVEAEKARALRARLEHEHTASIAQAVRRPEYRWVFVPYDSSYWFPNTCADVAADWFEELGCSVGWAPIRAGLCVAEP